MGAEPHPRWTVEAYLARERAGEEKHEYCNGELFAMSGASREHNLIAWNIVGALHAQLKRGSCEGYAHDMRVHVPATGLCTYPDVVVVCGDPRFEDENRDTLLNPTLIVEVLSPSTEDDDRGRKFANYRSIDSLRSYLLVAQDQSHVEHFARQQDGRWLLSESDDPAAVLDLSAIRATLSIADVYDRVPLAAPERKRQGALDRRASDAPGVDGVDGVDEIP